MQVAHRPFMIAPMEQPKTKRDTKSVGDLSEAVLIAVLIQSGYEVLLPFGEDHRYDLVIDDGRTLARVQVKTGRLRKGAILFNTYSSHAHRGGPSSRPYAGEIDYFGVYCADVDSAFLIPVGETSLLSGTLRVVPPRNGQTKRVRWAERYFLGHVPKPKVGLGPGRLVSLPGLSDVPS